MPLELFTPVPIVNAYVVFAVSEPGTIVSVVVVASNEKLDNPPPGSVMFVLLRVVAFIFVLNFTNIFAILVGILMLPGNGVVPSTAGGVVFSIICPAPPAVKFTVYGWLPARN